MFQLLKTEGKARRGVFTCAHGTVQTPVFMNVGTQARHQGRADARRTSRHIGYAGRAFQHLPSASATRATSVVHKLGGLHKFMTWDGPDSDRLRRLSGLFSGGAAQDQGRRRDVRLASRRAQDFHGSGGEHAHPVEPRLGYLRWHLTSAWKIRQPMPYGQSLRASARQRWLGALQAGAGKRLPECSSRTRSIRGQQLWGINQGATFKDLRIWHMQEIAKLDLPGYAIGGLAVGESTTEIDVRHHRRRRALYAEGQAAVSHGGRHAVEHHRGRRPRRGLFRLRHARAQCAPRASSSPGRAPSI